MSNKAREFDKIAHEIFAPIYPAIAKQVLDKAQINEGICLDIGCGGGYLGLAIAEAGDLNIYSMDNKPEAIEILQENILKRQFELRIKPLIGDVHNIPLETDSVQIAISRGSMFFWEEQVQALNEIYRVLAPGGFAYIGGGFGTPQIKEKIDEKMLQINPNWLEFTNKNIGPDEPAKWHNILSKTNIPEFNIEHNPVEMWIVFRK
ncbi:MAG TPA: class I SAM-dependent methyltransferase [Clostridia bacterium]|nr:class I SAM-dependent methyltransferase [Clostridia bacterium]